MILIWLVTKLSTRDNERLEWKNEKRKRLRPQTPGPKTAEAFRQETNDKKTEDTDQQSDL